MSEKDLNGVSNEVVHYRYSNKPVVVATVNVADDENVLGVEVAEFLESEGIKFDHLLYDENQRRYYAMLSKKGFEKCK